jgi:hypothetical protein
MKKFFMIIVMALFTIGASANINPELEKVAADTELIMDAMLEANSNVALYAVAARGGSCTFYLGGSLYHYQWDGYGQGYVSVYGAGGGSTSSISEYAARSVCKAAEK